MFTEIVENEAVTKEKGGGGGGELCGIVDYNKIPTLI